MIAAVRIITQEQERVHLFPYRTEKLIPTVNVGTIVLHYNTGDPRQSHNKIPRLPYFLKAF